MRPPRWAKALSLLLLLAPLMGLAKETRISARPVSPEDHAALLATYKSSSEGKIEGDGSLLRLTYQTPTPMSGLIVAFRRDNAFDPADLLGFTLPAASHGEVLLDLTSVPGWSPGLHQYLVSFYSSEPEGVAQVRGAEILGGDTTDIFRAAAWQLLLPEDFKVSSYHMLRGYRVLGLPLTVLLGTSALILAMTLLRRRPGTAIVILIGATMLYSGRVSADLLRFSAEHLSEWQTKSTYDQAGSMYELSAWVRKNLPESSHIFVCHDSTDYYGKVLRMFSYPIRVTATATFDSPPTHVLVTRKLEWNLENGEFSCGPVKAPAKELARFSDGSILFALSTP